MRMSRQRFDIQSITLLIVLCLSAFASTAFGMDLRQSDSPYLLEGYDVVSYFSDSGPVEGDKKIQLVHEEHTLLFSTLANLEKFKADPDTYFPAFDGYCAYGVAYGMKAISDPEIYDIVDGRLYLQLNAGVKNRWNRRSDGHIKKAHRVWKKLDK